MVKSCAAGTGVCTHYHTSRPSAWLGARWAWMTACPQTDLRFPARQQPAAPRLRAVIRKSPWDPRHPRKQGDRGLPGASSWPMGSTQQTPVRQSLKPTCLPFLLPWLPHAHPPTLLGSKGAVEEESGTWPSCQTPRSHSPRPEPCCQGHLGGPRRASAPSLGSCLSSLG